MPVAFKGLSMFARYSISLSFCVMLAVCESIICPAGVSGSVFSSAVPSDLKACFHAWATAALTAATSSAENPV